MPPPGDVRRAAAGAAALLAAAFGPAAAEEGGVVSIGGAITEIAYALGAGDRLVARDSTSVWPEAALALPDVGYLRRLSAEPILAMRPGLILLEADAGPPAALDQLRAAGANVATIPDAPTPAGVVDKVAAVAAALGLEAEGRALAARLEREFAEVRARAAAVEDPPRVLFLLSVGQGAPMAAGRDTSADSIIALAGAANAVAGFEGYKPLSMEAAAGAAPDVLLVTERTLDRLGGRGALLARPEVAATRAGREGRLVVMDGLLLLGFGPRAPEAARLLADEIHSAAGAPAAER